MCVHDLIWYGFLLFCVIALIVGVKIAVKKKDWMSRIGAIVIAFFVIIGGWILTNIIFLFFPYGATWP